MTTVATFLVVLCISQIAFSAESALSEDLRGIVESWRMYDAIPPDPMEIKMIEKALPGSLKHLEYGLTHASSNVRRCAAYTIARLGSKVSIMAATLRHAIRQEKHSLCRRYMAESMARCAPKGGENEKVVREMFASERDPIVKVDLAGAVIALQTSPEKDKDAWKLITESLTLPAKNDQPNEVHWDRCWTASRWLGILGATAKDAISNMRSLADNQKVPVYVRQRLNEDIDIVLKGSSLK